MECNFNFLNQNWSKTSDSLFLSTLMLQSWYLMRRKIVQKYFFLNFRFWFRVHVVTSKSKMSKHNWSKKIVHERSNNFDKFFDKWLFNQWLFDQFFDQWLFDQWLFAQWLFDQWLFDRWLFAQLLFDQWLFDRWLFDRWLFDQWLFDRWLFAQWLFDQWLFDRWLFDRWLFDQWLFDQFALLQLKVLKVKKSWNFFNFCNFFQTLSKKAKHTLLN